MQKLPKTDAQNIKKCSVRDFSICMKIVNE